LDDNVKLYLIVEHLFLFSLIKKYFNLTLFLVLILLALFFEIIEFNKSEIAPTRKEIYLLKKKFKNIEIKHSGDIIRIQNLVLKI
jgi:hypothetical protein